MSSVHDDVAVLRKEIDTKRLEAEKLSRLAEEYPDIQKHTGRWNKVAYYSKSVNTKVQRFDLRHNCGCCNDSPLELWPYLETPHGNVYSDPPSFQVGEKHWIAGDEAYGGWKLKLRNAGIPEEIIGAVQVHFDEGKQARIEAAESSNEDPGDEEREEPDPLV